MKRLFLQAWVHLLAIRLILFYSPSYIDAKSADGEWHGQANEVYTSIQAANASFDRGLDKRVTERRKDFAATGADESGPNVPKNSENSDKMVKRVKRALSYKDMWTAGETHLEQKGKTGIAAMQVAVVDDSHMIIIDRAERNTLQVDGHPAWGSIYNLDTGAERALNMKSNAFCAGGSWLSNGVLINVGGNLPSTAYLGPDAKIGDDDGLQSIRLFMPCPNNEYCGIWENAQYLRMAAKRWYASTARLPDGSVFIMGGSKDGGFINNKDMNTPSIEYWPPKNLHGKNGLPIDSPFLKDTLNSNLFPIVFHLPEDRIFVAANTKAMIYDYQNNTEHELPKIPNGIRVTYPMTAGAVMLPLSEENEHTPEILICGGSNIDDKLDALKMSSQIPASKQCIRMVLDNEGIKAGWQVEEMPQARLMPDLVLLPNGDVLIVNGAQKGVAGYTNVKDPIDESNADDPAYTPVVYRPSEPPGKRFLDVPGMPNSKIARMYHSVATLLPSGEVLIAGSNPHADVMQKPEDRKYPTEYRIERLAPPYMTATRPSISDVPKKIPYKETFLLGTDLPDDIELKNLKVSLVDLGFVTHSVHMSSRLVTLEVKSIKSGKMEVEGPPSELIYPPGPGWLCILNDGIPSVGRKVIVGDGKAPPIDKEAEANMLANP